MRNQATAFSFLEREIIKSNITQLAFILDRSGSTAKQKSECGMKSLQSGRFFDIIQA